MVLGPLLSSGSTKDTQQFAFDASSLFCKGTMHYFIHYCCWCNQLGKLFWFMSLWTTRCNCEKTESYHCHLHAPVACGERNPLDPTILCAICYYFYYCWHNQLGSTGQAFFVLSCCGQEKQKGLPSPLAHTSNLQKERNTLDPTYKAFWSAQILLTIVSEFHN